MCGISSTRARYTAANLRQFISNSIVSQYRRHAAAPDRRAANESQLQAAQ